ncbi:hypothetical protein EJC49_03290 [Aquibium carbonis]|uniref:Uncharacterized protein n=1 Tax=Aquibium carbonis TaxID=2495581 RepID=A0A3R9ZU90_9HYPH|nr:hypothetical protein [Aquibium carbonis]RST87863.1 hypothetical protein EJC49_03290 [Aquibium carbonis]
MKSFLGAALVLLAASSPVLAASALNNDTEVRVLVVTEGSKQEELVIAPGQTVQFCFSSCFVTMPDGDRFALSGNEVIEISGGRARIK